MKVLYLVLFVFIASSLLAQPNTCKHHEQIKAQKIAFLTEKLDLSVQEAQVFWPIYNEYEKKKDDIFNAQRDLAQKMMKSDNLSEKEMETLTDKYIELEQTEAKLLSDYHLKFKKVLPIKKVMILYTSDRLFKRELLKQLKKCSSHKED
ncbi:MAG: hypothetical protein ACUVQP_02550 [Bacteroidales bacterium]